MFIDDIKSLDVKYDKIFNSTIYKLDNSTFNKYDKLLFNESDENIVKDVECNISNKERQNYILNCKTNEALDYNLQSTISFIDIQEILLINFADLI